MQATLVFIWIQFLCCLTNKKWKILFSYCLLFFYWNALILFHLFLTMTRVRKIFVENAFRFDSDIIILGHYCQRDCSKSHKELECVYNFTLELFSTFSVDCLNCPLNKTDCFSQNCISSNGYQRGVRSINRQIPGPGIHVCQNDTIVINLLNNMNTYEATSLHSHGILQKGTPYMVIFVLFCCNF